jgi:hypothetical protein
MKKSLKNLLLATSAIAMLNFGSCSSKKADSIKEVEAKTQIGNPEEVYAVLANGSGPSQAGRYSQSNAVYSALNILSAYKLLKQEGAKDENITLLMYNPAEIDFLKTKEYKSLLEKKAFAKVLPSEEDTIQIDGKATKNNFLDAITKLPSDSNDSIYIIFSIPAPKKQEDTEIMYGSRNPYIQLDKETIFSVDIASAIKDIECKKMIIIQNSGDSANLLPTLEINGINRSNYTSSTEKKERKIKKLLGIVSPNTKEMENEIFIIRFISEYMKDKNQPIQGIMKKLDINPSFPPKAYYFEGGKRSPEECPWFYSPFMKN